MLTVGTSEWLVSDVFLSRSPAIWFVISIWGGGATGEKPDHPRWESNHAAALAVQHNNDYITAAPDKKLNEHMFFQVDANGSSPIKYLFVYILLKKNCEALNNSTVFNK